VLAMRRSVLSVSLQCSAVDDTSKKVYVKELRGQSIGALTLRPENGKGLPYPIIIQDFIEGIEFSLSYFVAQGHVGNGVLVIEDNRLFHDNQYGGCGPKFGDVATYHVSLTSERLKRFMYPEVIAGRLGAWLADNAPEYTGVIDLTFIMGHDDSITYGIEWMTRLANRLVRWSLRLRSVLIQKTVLSYTQALLSS